MADPRMGRVEPISGHGPLYTLDGVAPRVHPTAFIAPNAAVIGDVEIGPESGVWFGCVVRGDTNKIRIGARSNIQDGTIVHVDDASSTTIGDDVTIGHGAIIHGCTLRDRAFVGMGSTVLDLAVIEEEGRGKLCAGKRRQLVAAVERSMSVEKSGGRSDARGMTSARWLSTDRASPSTSGNLHIFEATP